MLPCLTQLSCYLDHSRDPGECACAEGPVSGATCAAALGAHCAQTQLICGSAVRSACAVKMSAGGNSRITAWRGLMASKGLSGAAPVLEGYGLSCEHDLSLLADKRPQLLPSGTSLQHVQCNFWRGSEKCLRGLP
jgi:hypothetical protein